MVGQIYGVGLFWPATSWDRLEAIKVNQLPSSVCNLLCQCAAIDYIERCICGGAVSRYLELEIGNLLRLVQQQLLGQIWKETGAAVAALFKST